MQLKNGARQAPGEVAAALATATCALLGTGAPSVVLAQDIGKWQVDTAGFYYSESGRVDDLSLNVLARTQPFEDRYLNLTFGFDALSGASPNGAAPSASPQTFPRPITLTRTSGGGTVQSGGGAFTTAPGELPVDSSFQDTRYAGSANWQRPLGRLGIVDFGGGVSVEHDYTHLGLDAHVAHDFNNRNTTLSAGLGWSDDSVEPIGGMPVAFSALRRSSGLVPPGGESQDGGAGSSSPKHVSDLLLGVTQVLNQHTIAQLNYSRSQSDGYLTDPYKIISVVDPVTGDLTPGPDPGIGLYLYENRPSTRTKQSLYGLLKHDFSGNVLDASYRIMTDDWGVDSNTVDMHFRWRFSPDKFLEPHVRFYTQSAASFYHTVLFDGEPLPQYATADYRLAELNAMTLGLEFGAKTSAGQFSARLEVYRQSAKPSPDALVGSLRGLDLTPDLTAVIAQITYKFGW
jgi:hypothetical protein